MLPFRVMTSPNVIQGLIAHGTGGGKARAVFRASPSLSMIAMSRLRLAKEAQRFSIAACAAGRRRARQFTLDLRIDQFIHIAGATIRTDDLLIAVEPCRAGASRKPPLRLGGQKPAGTRQGRPYHARHPPDPHIALQNRLPTPRLERFGFGRSSGAVDKRRAAFHFASQAGAENAQRFLGRSRPNWRWSSPYNRPWG